MMRTLLIIFTTFMSVHAFAIERAGSGPIAATGIPGPELLGTGTELIQDGSFELGTPNPEWNETSTNFGTPLCDEATCGLGGGTGPNTGLVWAWFGGITAAESGSVDQDIVIPTGTATLSFQLEVPLACADPTDFLEARVDGNVVFRVDGNDPECAGAVGYSPRSVDISAFADGGTHNVGFFSTIAGTGTTNFFVDDVSVVSVAGGPALPPPPAVPTLGWFGLTALALLLIIGTVVMRRRQEG